MKQVLMVNLGRQYGGAERYIENVLKLMGDEYCFHIFARENSSFYTRCQANGFKNIVPISLRPIFVCDSVIKALKYIRKYDIDIIHTHGINSEVFAYLLRLLLGRKKISFISTVHGIAEMDRINEPVFKRRIFSQIQIFVLRHFDTVIAVSESIKEDLIGKGLDSNIIPVIYHFVDCNNMERKYSHHDPLKICCVGRLEKVKNIELLIDAIANMTDYDSLRCDIYGEGSLRESLQIKIDELGMTNIISLKGFENDVNRIYNSHDVLVQTSFYESFGLTVIEAMKCGLLVVCSKVGGMAEIVNNGINGLLFESNNVVELTNILENICLNKYNMISLSQNAQREVMVRFSPLRHKKLLQHVYEGR